ncbi:MAG: Coenzyme F420 hydrogenase/dehydrogenase, beta subunit C-terminal domain, partial [Sedimentisphaerales bacterium]
QAVALVNVCDEGIRPVVDADRCRKCGACVEVCPGIEISHKTFDDRGRIVGELNQAWGPVLEVWEGYASDSEIRFRGSSGGAATALALYCLEKRNVSGVLHVAAGAAAPLENVPVLSRTRTDLMARTGSRYSPAAPCEKLPSVRDASRPAVFIGKPCDVVALRKSQANDARLRENVVAAISIFCAGTPVTRGTYRILEALSVTPEEVSEFRYRGCGWPGMTTVSTKDPERTRQMTYEQSWGKILCNHIQFRCRLCPDSTGEFADISCGDPWYRPVEAGEPGRSLVLVRTETGRQIVQDALKAGYVELNRVDSRTLPDSQKALLNRRRHLWGRLLTMKMMRVPVPRYAGFDLFGNWRQLSAKEKLKSIAGTMKRILSRGWAKPQRTSATRAFPLLTENREEALVDSSETESRCKA